MSSMFQESCVGYQLCTCDYPDHSEVTLFELGTDEITKKASGMQGTGPGNCEDLKEIGYNLNGFYLVRFMYRRSKAIYCDFARNIQTIDADMNKLERSSLPKEGINEAFGKEFCGGVGIRPCTFYYAEYPDEQKTNEKLKTNLIKNSKKPSSCEDLKIIGYQLNGFYLVGVTSRRVKIVHCNFNQLSKNGEMKAKRSVSNKKSKRIYNKTKIKPFNSQSKSKFCYGVGSMPCSCYFSNYPNILQFELSTDALTKNVVNENDMGPKNCEELASLGHTLNGFYMVRHTPKTIKTVYCKFDFYFKQVNTEKNQESMATTNPSTSQKFKIFNPVSSTLDKFAKQTTAKSIGDIVFNITKL